MPGNTAESPSLLGAVVFDNPVDSLFNRMPPEHLQDHVFAADPIGQLSRESHAPFSGASFVEPARPGPNYCVAPAAAKCRSCVPIFASFPRPI